GAPGGPETGAVVKWFNGEKGFGFVELEGGGGDAFLHISVLSRAGYQTVSPGATLRVSVSPGQKGPQIAEVVSVDESTATQGGGDAFLHISVLSRAGYQTVSPGATLRVSVSPGQKGPQIAEVVSVDESTATQGGGGGGGGGAGGGYGDRPRPQARQPVDPSTA